MRATAKIIWITVFFILYTCSTDAQTIWIDSVKNAQASQKDDISKISVWLTLSDTIRFSYPDSALRYAQLALALSEKLKIENYIFWSIVSVNSALYILGNYALELDYAIKAVTLAKKLNTPYTLGYSNGMLSDCYYNLGEFSTSLLYWREVVKISERSIPEERSSVYGNLSHIFISLHLYDSALKYAEKSRSLFNLNKRISPAYNNKQLESLIHKSLGDAYEGKKLYDSALCYYRLSLAGSENIQMEMSKVDAYNGMALVFFNKSVPDSAIIFARYTLAGKMSLSYPIGLLKTLNLLADAYQAQNKPDSALKYLRQSEKLSDSIFNREKTNAFQNLIFKEQEKTSAVESAKLELKRQYFTYALLALSLSGLIVVALIFKNRKQKQIQYMRNRIADDLHDDIGSALSSISIISELARRKSPELAPLLDSVTMNAQLMQENMGDIVWAVQSQNDRFENIVLRMTQFAEEILESKNIKIEFTTDANIKGLRLPMQQRRNFYLFFKEVINNAAKYSGADKVEISIKRKNGQIELNIRDDGIGFDKDKITEGNGMNTLKRRAAELKADFHIISESDKGTAVMLRFRVT